MARFDLTDFAWSVIPSLLPNRRRGQPGSLLAAHDMCEPLQSLGRAFGPATGDQGGPSGIVVGPAISPSSIKQVFKLYDEMKLVLSSDKKMARPE